MRSASADAEGRVTVDCHRGIVDRRTRILAVSWVAYGNGYRVDLAELSSFCRERGIKSIVDGIQAVGVLAAPVSELGADVVIAGGRKAQFGLAGAGFMYANPEMIETVVPPDAAELSFALPDRALPELELAQDAHRFEYGNANFLGCWVQRRSAEFNPWEGALTPSQ